MSWHSSMEWIYSKDLEPDPMELRSILFLYDDNPHIAHWSGDGWVCGGFMDCNYCRGENWIKFGEIEPNDNFHIYPEMWFPLETIENTIDREEN